MACAALSAVGMSLVARPLGQVPEGILFREVAVASGVCTCSQDAGLVALGAVEVLVDGVVGGATPPLEALAGLKRRARRDPNAAAVAVAVVQRSAAKLPKLEDARAEAQEQD